MPTNPHDTALYLHSANEVRLVQTPEYLYPNDNFTLSLRIEQDPLKLFPFLDMLDTQEAVDWVKANTGLGREQCIPFLLQMRALWALQVNPASPRNSVYQNFYPDLPSSPDTPFSPLGDGLVSALHVDPGINAWYGTRAFRVGVRIVIGEQWITVLPCPDNGQIIVTFGGNYKGLADPPGKPCEATYAFSADYGFNDFISPPAPDSDNSGVTTLTGGGVDYDYIVTWDGFCICTVDVTSKGQPIRVGLHVEQDELEAPGGWAVNFGGSIDWYGLKLVGDSTLPPVNANICTIANTLPYCDGMGGYEGGAGGGAFIQDLTHPENDIAGAGLGAWVAGLGLRWVGGEYDPTTIPPTDIDDYAVRGLPAPRDTPWQKASTYSIDSTDYDWTDTGYVNLRAHEHTMAYGHVRSRFVEIKADGSTILEDRGYEAGLVRSIACYGAALPWADGSGGLTEIKPLQCGIIGQLNTEPASTPYGDQFGVLLARWFDAAQARLATYNKVVEPPKVKISATFGCTGETVIPTTTAVYYATLPYTYQPQTADFKFQDVYTTVDPDVIHFTRVDDPTDAENDYNEIFDVSLHISADRFSHAQIGAAVLNCELLLDKNGLAASWLQSLDDFTGDSTIPEVNFAAGADSFIFDTRNPITYQDWLGL